MTNAIKGLAIIMMVIHHTYGFPSKLVVDIPYPQLNFLGEPLEVWVGVSTQYTVDVFAFMTGWGYFYVKDKSVSYGLKKIVNFLKYYWFQLFLIFIPATLVIRGSLSTSEFLLSLVSADETNIVPFAWYVNTYILLMLTAPFLIKKMLTGKAWFDFTVPFAIYTALYYASYIFTGNLYTVATNYFYFTQIITIGYLMVNYKVFDKVKELFKWIPNSPIIYLVGVLLAIFLKAFATVEHFRLINPSLVLVPLLVYNFVNLMNSIKWVKVKDLFVLLGEHAMNIWFLHGLFFGVYINKTFQWFAYIPKHPILVVIWVFLICLLGSFFINRVIKKLDEVWLSVRLKKTV